MELWIRSQDKETLIKVDAIYFMDDYIGNKKHIYSLYTAGITFAIYKTKERTLEVLDEIQHILEQKIDINYPMPRMLVYEMPKE